MKFDRRSFLKGGVVIGASGAASMTPLTRVLLARSKESTSVDGFKPKFTPFKVPMPKPQVLQQTTLAPIPGSMDARVGSNAVFHGIAPEFFQNHPIHKAANNNPRENRWDRFTNGNGPNGEELYSLTMKEGTHQFVPNIDTPIFGYADTGANVNAKATFPGPTILARNGQPAVVRVHNQLPAETSVHLHGDHTPAHSDGYPDFYVLQDKTRDYYYPNIAPRTNQSPKYPQTDPRNNGEFEVSSIPTTMWYHDHGMDITGFTVSSGLAAFYLVKDDLEEKLISDGVLPEVYGEFDVPVALQDQLFHPDGTLVYDFLDHNGRVGNVFTVNGVAQPFFKVKRGKYRFRFLNASNARIYTLRLSTGQPFIQIGQDTWEFPKAISLQQFDLWTAQRFDCIIDFSDAPDICYLENVRQQDDGRCFDKLDPDNPTPLIKFIVEGNKTDTGISADVGTKIRPVNAITEDEICATREFEFVRRNGAWQINNTFFSPRRSDAVPLLNSAERWIFKNSSGGWCHPIHIHLEGHEIQKFNGKTPPQSFKGHQVDVSPLFPGGESEFFIKFRTFQGPFVFHCHNLEHEDIRMMHVFDPREKGQKSMNNGIRPHSSTDFEDQYGFTAEQNSGMPEEPNANDLLFNQEGDVDRLEDRGVGIPNTDFERGGQTMPPVKGKKSTNKKMRRRRKKK